MRPKETGPCGPQGETTASVASLSPTRTEARVVAALAAALPTSQASVLDALDAPFGNIDTWSQLELKQQGDEN